MNCGKYQEVLDYARSCISDVDYAHTCRVLSYALQILVDNKKADASVVILAAMLHDTGRSDVGSGDHALTGSEKSYNYLVENGYSDELARHVADSILTHSNYSETKPQTLEAKILFDADKLDTTGAVGTARAIMQCQLDETPIYTLGENGLPLGGRKDDPESLVRKYKRKLRKLDMVFYTKKAKEIAAKHQPAMDDFFEALTKEIDRSYKKGNELINKYCK